MRIIFFIISIFIPFYSNAQIQNNDTTQKVTLDECIKFALNHQPLFQQTFIDQEVTHRNIRASLSAWLPQVNSVLTYQHNFILPVSLFPNFSDLSGPRVPVRIGVKNTANALFEIDQVLYSNQVFLASRAARDAKKLAQENITNSKINLIVNISKAFYDILLTEQQQKVIHETVEREKILLTDAHRQYENGITDKIDFMRTSITLNISLSDEKRSQESLKYKYAFIKQLMGYPPEKNLILSYDNNKMRNDILVDTLHEVNYKERVEFKLLNSQMNLQRINIQYYEMGFIPTITSFINYNFLFQNQSFENMFKIVFPNSAFGLKVAIPFYTGGLRFQNIQIAKLQAKRINLNIEWFKEQVASEYAQALGNYKSSLFFLKVQEENLQVAIEVYNLLKFQYDEGVKPYIDVISAETDLRTSQINYLNALYNTLSAKLDFMRALGTINSDL